jgi:hypothetical protein
MGTGVIVIKSVTVASGGSLTDTGASVVNDIHAVGAATVSISGGTVGASVTVNGTAGTVGITGATIGADLNVDGSAGAVDVSGNTVSKNVNVTANTPGGATVNSNTDTSCHQNNNHPYTGSGNSQAGNCNESNT